MPADAFFDTAILVYTAVDDPLRSELARELVSGGGMTSVQVLNEFVNVARGKLKRDWTEIADRLALIRGLLGECISLTPEVHDAAVELARRCSFHIYDALIVAAALEGGCTTLFTEDLQDGQRIGELTVRNPFRRRN